MRLDDPKRAAINTAHADLRRRHFDNDVRETSWRMWPRHASPVHECVESHIARHGYRDPIAWVDWPGGWFVSLRDERVLFVPMTLPRGQETFIASFPHDYDIVEVTRA